jgi:isochorismate hydrolase
VPTSLPDLISYPMPDAGSLPAAVVDWQPDPARCALLIHDMQRHFLRPYDRAAEPASTLVPAVADVAARARTLGIPVFYTAQPADQPAEKRALLTDFWGPGMTGDADGARIIDELTPEPADTVLTKWRYSAFAYTDLADRLAESGRDQLVVTGVYASIGCAVTAVEAFMGGVQPFLVADALGDFTRADHDRALQWTACRAGRVLTTADLLDRWSVDLAAVR